MRRREQKPMTLLECLYEEEKQAQLEELKDNLTR